VACSCDVFSLVVCLEMINSALEKLADAVHPDWSEQVGFAKDLAAGAVLVSIGAAAAAGLPVYVSAFSRRFLFHGLILFC